MLRLQKVSSTMVCVLQEPGRREQRQRVERARIRAGDASHPRLAEGAESAPYPAPEADAAQEPAADSATPNSTGERSLHQDLPGPRRRPQGLLGR